tara:strand:- start:68 stop:799 length:732 start_codon:yes stop_codon:yes gene_type:complete
MRKLTILLFLLFGCQDDAPINNLVSDQGCNTDEECNASQFTSMMLMDEMGNEFGSEGDDGCDSEGSGLTPEEEAFMILLTTLYATDIINQLDSLLTDSLNQNDDKIDSLIQTLEDSLGIVIGDEDDLFTATGDFTIEEMIIANSNISVTVTMPTAIALGHPYPNPFTDATSFDLYIPSEDSVNVSIMDDECNIIHIIHAGVLSTGSHSITWDAGENIPDGYYRVIVSDLESEIYKNMRKDSDN